MVAEQFLLRTYFHLKMNNVNIPKEYLVKCVKKMERVKNMNHLTTRPKITMLNKKLYIEQGSPSRLFLFEIVVGKETVYLSYCA